MSILFGFSFCHKYLCHWPQLVREISFNFDIVFGKILIGNDPGFRINQRNANQRKTNYSKRQLQQQNHRQCRESIISMKFIDIFESNWKQKQDDGNYWKQKQDGGEKCELKMSPMVVEIRCNFLSSSKLILSIKHSTYLFIYFDSSMTKKIESLPFYIKIVEYKRAT